MLLSIATVAILGSLVSPGLAHVESRATACSPALSMSESDPYNVLLASNHVVGWEWTKSTIALDTNIKSTTPQSLSWYIEAVEGSTTTFTINQGSKCAGTLGAGKSLSLTKCSTAKKQQWNISCRSCEPVFGTPQAVGCTIQPAITPGNCVARSGDGLTVATCKSGDTRQRWSLLMA